MNTRNRQFVSHVKQHLAQYGMRLVIGRGKLLNCGGYRCEGYFSDKEKVIKIARHGTNFLETLVHEYCHFLQYLSNSKIYIKSDKAILIVDAWFAGQNFDQEKLRKAFFIIRAMERDCEKRAIRMIKKFNLEIDTKLYAKRANCYIYSHFLMEKTRKFYAYKKSPYRSPLVLKVMPSSMAVLSHRSIPPKIYSMLESFTI
jgi:hypothetical protein